MNAATRYFFENRFDQYFRQKRGEEFQDFFSTIMEFAHPGDFVRVRPWGREGDHKNDGYLRSGKTLHQCYAPDDMDERKAIAKIDIDFKGCLPYWGEHVLRWVFVHNARNGLGPGVTRCLLDLERAHPSTSLGHMGYPELRTKVFSLKHEDLSLLLGPVPTRESVLQVQFEDLGMLLAALADRRRPEDPGEILPVPADKIAHNELSEGVADAIHIGMIKASYVGRFLAIQSDPEIGDKFGQAMRQRYLSLRDAGYPPDAIFEDLLTFVGGVERKSLKHQSAVLAFVSYFFEQCDIFEAPPGPLGHDPAYQAS